MSEVLNTILILLMEKLKEKRQIIYPTFHSCYALGLVFAPECSDWVCWTSLHSPPFPTVQLKSISVYYTHCFLTTHLPSTNLSEYLSSQNIFPRGENIHWSLIPEKTALRSLPSGWPTIPICLGTIPVLALKVSHARKLLSLGQTRTVGPPTSNSEISAFLNFMQDPLF